MHVCSFVNEQLNTFEPPVLCSLVERWLSNTVLQIHILYQQGKVWSKCKTVRDNTPLCGKTHVSPLRILRSVCEEPWHRRKKLQQIKLVIWAERTKPFYQDTKNLFSSLSAIFLLSRLFEFRKSGGHHLSTHFLPRQKLSKPSGSVFDANGIETSFLGSLSNLGDTKNKFSPDSCSSELPVIILWTMIKIKAVASKKRTCLLSRCQQRVTWPTYKCSSSRTRPHVLQVKLDFWIERPNISENGVARVEN